MSKVKEAINALKQIGIPSAQQNERSALTLLALLDLKETDSWASAKQKLRKIHAIIVFINENYGRNYAENTRESIRRQTLHQFEHAAIVRRNPDDPSRPTNSPKTVYGVTDDAFDVLKCYNVDTWKEKLKGFLRTKSKLVEKYHRIKEELKITVKLRKDILKFSPGKHNKLQAKVIQDLKKKFCPSATVLYVGDATRKLLYKDANLCQKLNIPITQHGKLPDVILYEKKKNILFLVEAVTFHGPITPKRLTELEEVLKDCVAKRIYISAFPTFKEFKKHINNLVWGTEVWIADSPGHMIHFNGPKFLYVYTSEEEG